MPIATQPSMMQLQADDWAQQTRLSAAQLHAFDLVVNGAEVSEIRQAIGATERQVILAAQEGCARAALPAQDLQDEAVERFMSEIASFVRLVGGGWPAEHRQEFIDQACIDLGDLPASLLAPAIRAARKRVYSPARFVSWVFEAVEIDNRKLQVELSRLSTLAEIALSDG